MSDIRNLSRAIATGLGTTGALALLVGATTVQAAETTTIEEVIVTAQKRNENLQDVPVSISVVSSEQLENMQVSQLTDISPYIPGLIVNSQGSPGQTALTLRGIAASSSSSTVGTYIDDTPVGGSSLYSAASIFQLDLLPYDVDRVEVLRGPQGTLYGASTIGGLLKYATKKPDLEHFEFRAGAEVFDMADAGDSGYGGRVGFNAPLAAGKVAIRGSYAYQRTPGYIDNPVLGIEDQNEYTQDGGRLAVLWQINDAVSLQLSGVWQSIDSEGQANEVAALPPQLTPLNSGRNDNNAIPQTFTKDIAYYSATLNWDFSWGSFVSASSYSSTQTERISDGTPVYGPFIPFFAPGAPPGSTTPFGVDLDFQKWTQEFRLASNTDGRLEWMVGGFYTDEESAQDQVLTVNAPNNGAVLVSLADFGLPSTFEELGIFANMTYKFTDRFDFAVGARWSTNDQTFEQVAFSPGLIASSPKVTSTEDVWTYMASPRFRITDDTMTYLRVASGYRPGGPNVFALGAPPQVNSDSVVNYELGLKTQFLSGHAYVDVAVFYMDWKDIQVGVTQNGISFLANAGAAVSQGVELSTSFIPLDGLTLGLNLAYTDSQLTADLPPPGVGQDGDHLAGIPEWAGSLTADYNFPVGSWEGRVGGGYRYTDDKLSSYESSPNAFNIDGYSAFDLSAGLSNDQWQLRLYARNVTDEKAYNILDIQSNALGQQLYATGTPITPRTVGFSVDVKF